MCVCLFLPPKQVRFVSGKTMFSRQNTDEAVGKQSHVCNQNHMQKKLFQYLIMNNEVYGESWNKLYNVILTRFLKWDVFLQFTTWVSEFLFPQNKYIFSSLNHVSEVCLTVTFLQVKQAESSQNCEHWYSHIFSLLVTPLPIQHNFITACGVSSFVCNHCSSQ